MQTEFFQRYLQDFISMTMTVTCEEDLQVVILEVVQVLSLDDVLLSILMYIICFSSFCVVP